AARCLACDVAGPGHRPRPTNRCDAKGTGRGRCENRRGIACNTNGTSNSLLSGPGDDSLLLDLTSRPGQTEAGCNSYCAREFGIAESRVDCRIDVRQSHFEARSSRVTRPGLAAAQHNAICWIVKWRDPGD